MELIKSERKKTKIKLALQGASGTGKTMSAILLSKGLVNDDLSKVTVIDSEQGSSHLYSSLGKYNVITLKPPFTPENYIKAIDLCLEHNTEVIIIDSISHCWNYLLNLHASLTGNSFTNWGLITKKQNMFIEKILQSDAHVIATMRSKQSYVLNLKNGKYVPEKIGMKAIQRNDIDYEFTTVFDINSKHLATATKDRTNLFTDKPGFVINASTGKKIRNWCEAGKDIEKALAEVKVCNSIEELKQLYVKYVDLYPTIVAEITKRKNTIESKKIITAKSE